MKLEDLKGIILSKVYLYLKDDDFKDLYNGWFDEIPEDMLNLKVRSIGARHDNFLDIRVEESQN